MPPMPPSLRRESPQFYVLSICSGSLRSFAQQKRTIIWIARVINMLSIGIPMALNYSITAIGTMILQSAVNVFGSSVVASFTAASKVNNIATQTMPTLGTAMATYCGQNSVQENTTVFSTVCAKDFSSVSLLQPSVLPSVFSVENLS